MTSAQTFGGWASEAATSDGVTAGNGQPRTPKAAALRTTKRTVGRREPVHDHADGRQRPRLRTRIQALFVDLEPARRLLQVPPTADGAFERAQSALRARSEVVRRFTGGFLGAGIPFGRDRRQKSFASATKSGNCTQIGSILAPDGGIWRPSRADSAATAAPGGDRAIFRQRGDRDELTGNDRLKQPVRCPRGRIRCSGSAGPGTAGSRRACRRRSQPWCRLCRRLRPSRAIRPPPPPRPSGPPVA